jgi:hypothetical protein
MKHLALPLRLALIATLVVGLAACASRIPRRRTLPLWVQRVHVPMFKNSTAEPGLAEVGTRLAVEQFLADGRLEASRREDADLVVAVEIVDFQQTPLGSADDAFPETSMITVTADVRLYEPSNREVPFASLGKAFGRRGYRSDTRSSQVVLEVDARESAMRNLANNVVSKVINEYRGQDAEGFLRESDLGLEPETRAPRPHVEGLGVDEPR